MAYIRKIKISKGRLAEAAATPTTSGCINLLMGWLKRFGKPINLFAFPINKKDHPNL